MHDPISTSFIGEEVVHGSSATSHLPKCPLQGIGSPDGLPELLVKSIVVQTAEKILSHAPDGPLLFDKPFGLPALETPEGLLTAVCLKDELCLLKTVRAIDLSDLYGHIAHLVGHTTLRLDERIDTPYGLQQCRITIGDNELEAFAMKPPTLEIRKKSPPGGLILHLSELEGEDFPAPLIFLGSFVVNGKCTQHDLFFDTDLPNLLANAIQKEKLNRVIDGLILEAFNLLIQRGQGRAHRLRAYLLTIELFGDPLELTGAYPIEEQTANSSIHIPSAPLIAVKDAESHTPLIYSRHLDILDGTKSAQKVSLVMAVAVTPTAAGPFIPTGTQLMRKLLCEEILNEGFDETLYS
jgi:hypothetical protein